MRLKPREVLPLLRKDGWRLVGIRGGSHAKFVKDGQHIIIPHYNKQNEVVNMNTQDAVLKDLFKRYNLL